jgi:cytochrome o ubiquinol oxidase subunit II
MFLGGIAWIASYDLDPYRPLDSKTKPIEIQAVSLDWKWLFIYPEQGVASVNQLVIPAGTPVHFSLSSSSVMNAFFVPQLGSMIYTMNGMADQLHLQADREGVFRGLSSHFSGDGFSDMHFEVRSVSTDAFNQWIEQTKSIGPALDQVAYGNLAKQSIADPPSTFHSVDPDLFQSIVSQKLPPGPGPRGGPIPDVSPKAGG